MKLDGKVRDVMDDLWNVYNAAPLRLKPGPSAERSAAAILLIYPIGTDAAVRRPAIMDEPKRRFHMVPVLAISTFSWILFAILWVAIAFWPARVAGRKGHSFLGYFVFSLIFFPLALIVAYAASDRTQTATGSG